MLKYPRRRKSWHASRGLKRPTYPRPNDTHWTPRKLADACTMRVDDAGLLGAALPRLQVFGGCAQL